MEKKNKNKKEIRKENIMKKNNEKSEIKISSDWGNSILRNDKKTMKNIHRYHKDSYGNDMPNNSIIIKNLLSEKECINLITESEKHGYGKTTYDQHYRSNLRLITVDESMAQLLFERIKQHMPKIVNKDKHAWEIIGLNECFRMSKYNVSNFFDNHYDTNFQRNSNEHSFFTLNIYLNSDYTGGETRFFEKTDVVASIKADPGDCLIFMQPPTAYLMHDGTKVKCGIKYLLRSDLMYKKINGIKI